MLLQNHFKIFYWYFTLIVLLEICFNLKPLVVIEFTLNSVSREEECGLTLLSVLIYENILCNLLSRTMNIHSELIYKRFQRGKWHKSFLSTANHDR